MNCTLCPRECGANRELNTGYCGGGANVRIARAALHFWEEPCISGRNGSGTVFFSGCPLRCVFCQNRKIALAERGTEVSDERLSEIFLELQEQGANNINLVTPTHWAGHLVPVLERAKRDGLKIPIVYNTGSYEKAEQLKRLEGLVDIWLPDLKYKSAELSARYSNAPDYFDVATSAIAEMVRQAGEPVFGEGDPATNAENTPDAATYSTDIACRSETGLIKRGVIVRHLVLPGCIADSKRIIRYLYETYGNKIFISIMNQYTPLISGDDARKFPELTRKVTEEEYNRVVDFAIRLGVENAYIQEGETASESFIPEFDGTGIEKR